MISPPLSNARRRLRRPPRAIVIATVLLSAFATGLAAPSVGLAQELDPLAAVEQSIDGGVTVPAEVETSLADAVEAGGVPAMPEALLEPEPAPAPSPDPPPTPEVDAPPMPDTGTLPETAPAPAPESQPSDVTEEPDLAAPVGPGNLNVDIRILSPGDNGDVTQELTVPASAEGGGGAAGGQPLVWNWNWTWNWTTPAGVEIPDVGDVLSGERSAIPELDIPALVNPEQFFEDAPPEQPAVMPPEEPARSSPSADRPRPARSHAAPVGGPAADPSVLVAGSTVGAASVAPDEARATQGRRQPNRGHGPAPEQAPTVLPSAAASSLSGGSSAPLAVVLLGLLCLLAPSALELARSRYRKLSSQLSSSRPERPG